jgi:hypothetical protein
MASPTTITMPSSAGPGPPAPLKRTTVATLARATRTAIAPAAHPTDGRRNGRPRSAATVTIETPSAPSAMIGRVPPCETATGGIR